MIRGVLTGLLRLSAQSATQIVGVMIARTLVPRLPPKNYTTRSSFPPLKVVAPVSKLCNRIVISKADEIVIRGAATQIRADTNALVDYLKPSIEVYDYDSAPATPRMLHAPELGDDDFSICTPIGSPLKARYITPIRTLYAERPDTVDMALLRAASQKISTLLEQSRKRVDSGQDPSDTRTAARRRRAEELGLLPSAM